MKAIIGSFYKHYRTYERYEVLNFAHHTETGEQMVVYQAQYDTPDLGMKPIFVRPTVMFEEQVDVDGVLADRFSECV